MRLVVGLGNPGEAYRLTRHNLGFQAVTALAEKADIPLRHSIRLKARLGRGRIQDEDAVFLLPLSYMNRSGAVVAKWLKAERFPLEKMLVILDDLHLPLGRLRFRARGSAGGHQGLLSIIEAVGSEEFPRLRLGIGGPPNGETWEEFVLKRFRPSEKPLVEEMVQEAVACSMAWVAMGTERCTQ